MRWDSLFADLEAQLAAGADSTGALDGLVRAEVARTDLADRMRAHVGAPVGLRLRDGQWLRGTLLEAAPQWVLVTDGESAGERQVLVPLGALERVAGLSRAVAPPAGPVERRLGLGPALRALARDRVGVALVTQAGAVTGTVDRVGADHLDLAVHPAGEARRPGAVSEVVAVPFAAVLAVRSAPG